MKARRSLDDERFPTRKTRRPKLDDSYAEDSYASDEFAEDDFGPEDTFEEDNFGPEDDFGTDDFKDDSPGSSPDQGIEHGQSSSDDLPNDEYGDDTFEEDDGLTETPSSNKTEFSTDEPMVEDEYGKDEFVEDVPDVSNKFSTDELPSDDLKDDEFGNDEFKDDSGLTADDGPEPSQGAAVDDLTPDDGLSATDDLNAAPTLQEKRFKLPDGTLLPAGEFPEVISFKDGFVIHTIDLKEGSHTTSRASVAGTPKDTFRVETFTGEPPVGANRYSQGVGVSDFIITPDGLVFVKAIKKGGLKTRPMFRDNGIRARR